MRKMTRVDETLDFEFKGHFEVHKVNWGQNVGFYLLDDLIYKSVKSLRL